MTDCCSSHSKTENFEQMAEEEPPKSFVGKFLYNLGKKDYEKEVKKGNKDKKCC